MITEDINVGCAGSCRLTHPCLASCQNARRHEKGSARLPPGRPANSQKFLKGFRQCDITEAVASLTESELGVLR